jgi:hypothetical protein
VEAKASRNTTAIPRHRVGLRERLGGLAGAANGNGAAPALDPNHPSAKLDRYLESTSAVALHHLKLPAGSRIDSLIVGPAGITVVDTSHYREKRVCVHPGGVLKAGRRNRSDWVYEALGQVAELRDVLAGTAYEKVPIEAAVVLGEVTGVPVIESFNHPRILTWGTRWVAQEASRPGPIPDRTVASLATLLRAELAR